jgi:hypothetical protein
MSFTTRHTEPFLTDTLQEEEDEQKKVEDQKAKADALFQELQVGAMEYGKHALMIGGVIAGVYVVMDALLPDEQDEAALLETAPTVRENPENGLSVGKALQGLAWTIAAGWARQQLTHYIEAQRKTDA